MIASFENTSVSSRWVSMFLTVVYSADIIINLLHPRILEGDKLDSLRRSQLAYLKFAFICDIIGALPWDLISERHMEHPEILQMIRFIYCRGLSKLISTNYVYHEISTRFQKTLNVGISFMTIFMLSGFLLVFLHIHACIVFLFGKVTKYSADSWHDIEHIIAAPIAEKYIWALFSAVSNTFPVTGYR
jgi:hypothetical protein